MEVYLSDELKPASLSSVNRGEVREKEGGREGIMLRERWERVRRTEENVPDRSTRAVDATACWRAEEILGRVELGLCVSA